MVEEKTKFLSESGLINLLTGLSIKINHFGQSLYGSIYGPLMGALSTKVGFSQVLWDELVELRDNSQLIPGEKYRIIDYTTTTTQTNTRSAGNQFDIIVTAIDNCTLSEDAKAIHHEGDTYFSNSNLAAWELKYCLDNDTTRFEWADPVKGKGVIYRMVDEFGNDCHYDFKNIQFEKSIQLNDGDEYFDGYMYFSEQGSPAWTYTFHAGIYTADGHFSSFDDEYSYEYTWTDFIDGSLTPKFHHNIINANDVFGTDRLSNNVFLGAWNSGDYMADGICHNNVLGFNCINNEFGCGCANNHLGNQCESNTFVRNCYSNTLGDGCLANTFYDYCTQNTLGDGCQINTFYDNCSLNTLGFGCASIGLYYDCYSNTFGNNCVGNTFSSSCCYNVFGNDCTGNTFDSNCTYNTFGEECFKNVFGQTSQYNTFGNGNKYNYFGKYCYANKLGNRNEYIKIGNRCSYNTFGHKCKNIVFGIGDTFKAYYRYIVVESGNQYIQLNCKSTTSSNNYYQNVYIGLGVNLTTDHKTIESVEVAQQFETKYLPTKSKVISV